MSYEIPVTAACPRCSPDGSAYEARCSYKPAPKRCEKCVNSLGQHIRHTEVILGEATVWMNCDQAVANICKCSCGQQFTPWLHVRKAIVNQNIIGIVI